MKMFLCSLFLSFSLISFGQGERQKLLEEIREIEKDFETDLQQKGIAFAFFKYAAPHAVIKREKDTLIISDTAIRNYYSQPHFKRAVASWSPDFIDLSDDGTMAYTYGRYSWTVTSEDGRQSVYRGIFHTVWKKINGTWKYVWD